MTDCRECIHPIGIRLGKIQCPKVGAVEPIGNNYRFASNCIHFQDKDGNTNPVESKCKCGKHPVTVVDNTGTTIRCNHCGIVVKAQSRHSAIAKWNQEAGQ